jgi:hypothetical protein
MKKFRKTFNLQRIKRQVCYSVQEITELLHVHKRTVLTWHEEGLQTIDDKIPYCFHGEVLREFLRKRQDQRKSTCQSDEFYCFKCHAPSKAWERLVDVVGVNHNRVNLVGLCETCGTVINRLCGTKKLLTALEFFEVQEVRNQHLIPSLVLSSITHSKQGDNSDEN